MTKALQNLGATPVTVPGAEFQTAMERGIVDGGVVAAISGAGYNLQEFTKYVFKADLGVSVIGVSINKKLYDSLPEDLKKVVDKGCKNYLVNQTKVYDSYDEEAYESFKKTGAEISTLEPAEKKRWLKVCTPIYSEWITDMEKKGLPGKKLYEEFKKILAGYGVELPI
jgi:TRAP-type C4-dicarboxylate transport system substrate-binding protein